MGGLWRKLIHGDIMFTVQDLDKIINDNYNFIYFKKNIKYIIAELILKKIILIFSKIFKYMLILWNRNQFYNIYYIYN